MHLGDLTIELAQGLVGTEFSLALADGRTTTLKLDEVKKLEIQLRRRQVVDAGQRQPFSLFFLGDPGIVLPQAMYTLRSDQATFDGIFLVPVDRDAAGTDYEAVFN